MTATAEAKIEEPKLVDDPRKDKQVVFQLLSKFNLSPGDVAEIFAAYLLKHPADEEDLDRLRLALRCGATESQARIIAAAGGLLTSEEVAELLGYGVVRRQTIRSAAANYWRFLSRTEEVTFSHAASLKAHTFGPGSLNYLNEFQMDGWLSLF